jgi:hypothetical protein
VPRRWCVVGPPAGIKHEVVRGVAGKIEKSRFEARASLICCVCGEARETRELVVVEEVVDWVGCFRPEPAQPDRASAPRIAAAAVLVARISPFNTAPRIFTVTTSVN